ncbi:hypothetical protein Ddye_006843 [Dipteronia dyeriana]|uniref:EF-hand domain-containing protein n=1 Tax=Dipteronia dyeriana TaxID=168575 RepID=A0AAE0CQX4_9ROSI|nr:hypothetical protein Ddye_006843 [Dipteronia dyeriana]
MASTTTRSVGKKCLRNTVNPVPVLPCTMEQLRGMFWRYDTNRDGKLSRKELKEAFNYLGAFIPGWRAHRALNHADGNGDGYITEEEVDDLVNYVVKLGYVKL